jgi:hypothetical protein
MTHAELFINVLIGHCIGDYWLQNTWMAKTKSKPGIDGRMACTLHVSLYSWAVCCALCFGVSAMGWWKAVLIYALIFIPHWLIDRYSLAGKWMELKNGVHPWKVWELDAVHHPYVLYEGNVIQKTWDVAFTAFVYIVSDNSLHLLCLWLLILKFL